MNHNVIIVIIIIFKLFLSCIAKLNKLAYDNMNTYIIIFSSSDVVVYGRLDLQIIHFFPS